jgi:hypothetical protein
MAQQHTEQAPREVTINSEQGLYVIPESHGGYSCLGFDVLIDRYNRLAAELGESFSPFLPELRGTLYAYEAYRKLMDAARTSGRRFTCDLSPQLTGLEGRRVEVETLYGERRRFKVGKSTGWIPCHLELANERSSGGSAAEREYKSVRVIR